MNEGTLYAREFRRNESYSGLFSSRDMPYDWKHQPRQHGILQQGRWSGERQVGWCECPSGVTDAPWRGRHQEAKPRKLCAPFSIHRIHRQDFPEMFENARTLQENEL